jgi:hypothetical protein
MTKRVALTIFYPDSADFAELMKADNEERQGAEVARAGEVREASE